MTCLADITKTYKTTKADSRWPQDNTSVEDEVLNPCMGKVTAVLIVVEEPHFGGTSAVFQLDWICSRCKNPFPINRREIDAYVAGGRVDLDTLQEMLR